jgi:hypothetical protein
MRAKGGQLVGFVAIALGAAVAGCVSSSAPTKPEDSGGFDFDAAPLTEDAATGTGDTGAPDAVVDARPEAGPPDTGVDAGQPDTGVDAGLPDTGVDAGQPDTGADAGLPDTGVDAGLPDTGVDAGLPDTGVDAGAPDTGPPDAGPTCGSDNGGCPVNSTCTIDGGIVCVCAPGFSGSTCASDCLTSNGGCDPNAACTVGDAGVSCTCDVGYTGSGTTCASDCLTSNGGCDPDATCSNSVAGVVCTCNAGFTGPGTSCWSNDYAEWSPPPDGPQEGEYRVSADGVVVVDTITGLAWQRQMDPTPCPADDAGAGACNWAEANAYCASLNATGPSGLKGTQGWRLPSVVELVSLVNYYDGTPTIDTSPFPATPLAAFWAHTADAMDSTQAWTVSFSSGAVATQGLTLTSAVRCVTSSPPPVPTPTCGTLGLPCCYADSCGADLACVAGTCLTDVAFAQGSTPVDSPPEAQMSVSSDGTLVTDPATGLHWQRQIFANPCPADADAGGANGGCTWLDAQSYCASLNAAGLGGITSGWRAPSNVELLSIANYAITAPAIDTALFPDTPLGAFWTQTPYALAGGQGWTVEFNLGQALPAATTTVLPVRCVSASAPSGPTACGTSGAPCCYGPSCGPNLVCDDPSSSSLACVADTNWQQSPIEVDNPPEAAFLVSPSGSTATDRATGLVWQRGVLANPCPADVDAGAPGGCTWSDAVALCKTLNGLGVGGYSGGWRLPSVIELGSILNASLAPNTAAIDQSIFPAEPFATYWASTPYALGAGQAWSVVLSSGTITPQVTATPSLVRCVNPGGVTPAPETCGGVNEACCYAGACSAGNVCNGTTCVIDTNFPPWTIAPDAPPPSEYTTAGGAVTDTTTGLAWAPASGTFTWSAAQTACDALNSAGTGGLSSGWRLPSTIELLSIVNYGATGAPYVASPFAGVITASPYWASTSTALTPGDAWSVSFADGSADQVAQTTAENVMCVN